MNFMTISLVLRALAAASGLSEVFGKGGEKLAPILNTLAGFAELPEETRAEQEALLEQVRGWVAENRSPTDAELDALKSRRDELDARLKEVRSTMGGLS